MDVGCGVKADADMEAFSWLYHWTKSPKKPRASARQLKRCGKVGAYFKVSNQAWSTDRCSYFCQAARSRFFWLDAGAFLLTAEGRRQR
jgi:hypothetical protein